MRALQHVLALATALACVVVPAFAQQDGPKTFAIEELNAGLDAPPEALDRSTPRATLEAFLTLADREAFDEASHLMDLAPIAPAEQSEVGPVLARKLAFLVERKAPVNWDGVPDRPDGMETLGSSREPMVGETRRSIALGTLELERWPVTLRLSRVQPEGADPVWVFSRQTVEHVDSLYDAFGPTWFERVLPDQLRGEAPWWGLLWWELIAFPLLILAAVALAVILFRLLTMISQRTSEWGVSLGVRRMRLPLVLLVVAIFLHVVVANVFVFSATTGTTISTVFWLLTILALVFGISRILDTVIEATSTRFISAIDDPQNTSARHWYTNLSAVKRIGVVLVVIVGLGWALAALDVFESFGLSLLVAAGAATAIFGLAAQTVLGNILASIQLALAKPIRIGDAVYYDNYWAYVEKINYTFVQLRTWDQKRYVVPVKVFVAEAFENWTKEDPELIMPVVLKLDHRADVAALRQAFHEFAPKDPDWADDAAPKVQVVGQDEDGIEVRFYCTATNPTAAWNLHCRMRERLVALLREEDEPSDLPRTRLAYVDNTLDKDVSQFSVYEDGYVQETGEPKGKPLRAAE